MNRIFFLFLLTAVVSLNALTESEKLSTIEELANTKGIDFVIENFIDREQNEYPKQKNKLETITSVFYIKQTKSKVYKSSISSNWRTIIKGDSKISNAELDKYLPLLMQEQAVNAACSTKLNRLYLKYGVKIVHRYSEIDGTYLFQTIVSDSDCKK